MKYILLCLILFSLGCQRGNITRTVLNYNNLCMSTNEEDICISEFSFNTNFNRDLSHTEMIILLEVNDSIDDLNSFLKTKNIILQQGDIKYELEYLEEIQIGGKINDQVLLSFRDINLKQKLVKSLLSNGNLDSLYNSFSLFVNNSKFYNLENSEEKCIRYSKKMRSEFSIYKHSQKEPVY